MTTTITDPEATPAVVEHLSGNGGVLPHWKAGAPFAGESTRTALLSLAWPENNICVVLP